MATIATESTNCVVCGADEGTIEARGKDYLHQTSDQEYRFCRCARCGHLYLNPRPTIAEIARIYPVEYATFTKKFARAGSVLAKIKDQVLLSRFDAVASQLPRGGRIRLLDVGCGDGGFLLALRRRFPDAELTGLDWSFGPTVAEELAAARIQVVTGTIEEAALAQSHYDVITMNQIIEHVWDARLVLRRCEAALAGGGLLAIETPNPDGWDRRFFASGAWGGYYWPRHLNLFSRGHLTRLLTECGMAVSTGASLLAPPCWIYSCQFSARRAGYGDWSKKVFRDTSVGLLALFAAVDRAAKLVGAETSNQKVIAVKPTAGATQAATGV